MIELLRTNDLVQLSFLDAVLRDGGIEPVVLDQHMSVLEGSAGAIPAAPHGQRRGCGGGAAHSQGGGRARCLSPSPRG